MSPPERSQRRLEVLQRAHPVDPESYAAARLGSMRDDAEVRALLEQRRAEGWEPLAAVDDVSHRVPERMFDLALGRIGPTGRILDLGAGEGSLRNFGRDYADVPNPIVAIDKVRPGREFPRNVQYLERDMGELSWDGEPFDLVLALHSMEQVPNTPALIARMRTIVRPGGTALVAIPETRWVHSLVKHVWKGDRYDEVNAYTFESFTRLMSDGGFRLRAWTCWPSYFSIHYGHVTLSDGRSLGELLDQIAQHYDRVNGRQSFSCYGYALDFAVD